MSTSVVVVTGASAGVGRAVATRFAEEGWSVGLLARGTAGLEGAAKDVTAAGGQALIVRTDVTDADAVEAAAAEVESSLGPIDVWVNSAMATVYSPIEHISPEEFRRATEVTYLGTVWGTMAALRRMRDRDRGTIVQVGSALAHRAIPLQAPYCGAKFAIRGFTDSLRSELRHDGSAVRLTMVQLPAVNTPQFDWGANHLDEPARPLAPVFQPAVAADAVWHAATHAPRELWLGGRNVVTMIASKFAGEALDELLARSAYDGQSRGPDAGDPQPYGRSNLFGPVDEDVDIGAHGGFDDEAHGWSPQFEVLRRGLDPAAVLRPAARLVGRVLSRIA